MAGGLRQETLFSAGTFSSYVIGFFKKSQPRFIARFFPVQTIRQK
jgi:hypothetical protein